MHGYKALENVNIYHLQQSLGKAPLYLMKLVMIGRLLQVIEGCSPRDMKQDTFVELQIVRPCFTKGESAVVGGNLGLA